MAVRQTISSRIQKLEKTIYHGDEVIVVYPLPNGEYPSPEDRYWRLDNGEVVSWSELDKLPEECLLLIWDIPTPFPGLPMQEQPPA